MKWAKMEELKSQQPIHRGPERKREGARLGGRNTTEKVLESVKDTGSGRKQQRPVPMWEGFGVWGEEGDTDLRG